MHHSLHDYAIRHKLHDPGFSDRPVHYQLVIDLKGKWLSGHHLGSDTEAHVTLRAPMQSGRTSGTAVSAVVESVPCYFGWKHDAKAKTPADIAKNRQRGLQLQGVYREHTARMATDTQDPYAKALQRFLDEIAEGRYGDPHAAAIKCLGWQSGKPLTSTEWVTVVVRANNALTTLYDRPAIREWIVNHRPIQSGGSGGQEIPCMITGRRGPLCNTQPPIKGLPGAKGGSSALSSNNKDAWCSYKLIQGANAPTTQDAAEAVSAAANFLTERVGVPFTRRDGTTGMHYKPRGGVYLNSSGKPQPGDAVFLIWTGDPRTELPVRAAVTALIKGPTIEPMETLLRIESADETSVHELLSIEADEKVVEELLAIHRTGRTMPLFNEDYFQSALISDNGRVVYRNATSGTIGDLRRQIQQYIDDIRLPIPDNSRPRPLSQIFTALQSRADQKFPPSAVDGMLRCILQGGRVPMELATAALTRCARYPGDKNERKQWRRLLPVRCGLLKLDLIRKGVPVTLYADPFKDENLIATPIPMVVGYIMAEADYVQNVAIDDPQRSSLSRTEVVQSPCNVLPSVLTLHTKHIKKLNTKRKGMAVLSQKRMNALVTRLAVQGPLAETGEATLSPTQIPRRFTRDDQMQFWLGFNNYRNWLFEDYRQRKAERERAKEATAANQGVTDDDDDEAEEGNGEED